MAFAVTNVVRGTPEELSAIIADVERRGFEDLRSQAGFRGARLYVAEDRTEAMTVTEWDSREQFLAYRQSEAGRRVVEDAVRWHPRIAFYDIAAAVDA
jgi:heme-degrading monooxygenase HmoA